MATELILVLLFFSIAILFSSVGHGGASGYLAAMAIMGVAPAIMKPSALILNVFVSAIAFTSFYRAGYFRGRIFWPFALASVPMAFIGARIIVNPGVYKTILALFLILAIARILWKVSSTDVNLRRMKLMYALLIGGALGFLSGMIGIGGGIILSPILILCRWTSVKEAAGISALFIFVNSLSGLAGVFTRGSLPDAPYAVWISVAVAGGLIGSFLGSRKFSIAALSYTLAGILFFASIKLLMF